MTVFPRMDCLRDMQATSADLGRDDRSQGACVKQNSALLHRMAAKETTAFDLNVRAGGRGNVWIAWSVRARGGPCEGFGAAVSYGPDELVAVVPGWLSRQLALCDQIVGD